MKSRALDLFLSAYHYQTIFDNGLTSRTSYKPPRLQKTVKKYFEPIFWTSQHIVVSPFIFSPTQKVPKNMIFEK